MKDLTKTALIVTIVTFLSCVTASAQEWHYGLTVGYENLMYKCNYDDEELDMNTISGFNVGALVGYDVVDYFGVQTGVKFVMNGYKTSEGAIIAGGKIGVDASTKTFLYYLEFPVYAIGRIPVGNAFIDVEAGPQLYAGLSGHRTVDWYVNGEKIDSEKDTKVFGKDVENGEMLDRFNCMIHVAGGVEYSGFKLMVGYNFGVYNIFNKTNRDRGNKMRTNGFVASVAYLF